jgi:hypothetical protein
MIKILCLSWSAGRQFGWDDVDVPDCPPALQLSQPMNGMKTNLEA